MEERRTAAFVVAILAVIGIFFTAVLPAIKHNSLQTLSFKNCSVHFSYRLGVDADEYRAAQNRLGKCLCITWQHNRDTVTGKQILNLYKRYGNKDSVNFAQYPFGLDSIVKEKNQAFTDTLVLLD